PSTVRQQPQRGGFPVGKAREIQRVSTTTIVMAGLDPAIHRIKIFEIIWSQLFVGWIAGSSPAMTESGFSHDAHNSRALLNENDDSRRVFSSRISERVSGGSARWL
ncbi:hypothetical protein, partial [Proteus mirabilis]|uniref:hypothetical protein n=1 Tax=Proteus mirabilis TaxID=584 RepID=UPI0019535C56